MLKTNGFIKKMVSRVVVVAALPIGLVTAPALTMPTQNMGEQASIEFDLDKGIMYEINDDMPHSLYKKDGVILKASPRGKAGQNLKNPVKGLFGNHHIGGGGSAAERKTYMSDGQMKFLDERFDSRYSSEGGGTQLRPNRTGSYYLD